ncbi:MAG TPA: DoxX family protein [Blastocatellia bacterium]|nr:DoxX family protein [Blastocatellia bacterium]
MASGIGRIRTEWAALPLEMVVGAIFFAHGLQKIIITPAAFAAMALEPHGIPPFMGYVVTVAEFGGGLLLLSGLLVRLAAFGHLCVMLVAIAQVHWQAGLTARGGFEFPLSLLAASIALIIIGGDPLSIDKNAVVSIHRARDTAIRRESVDVGSAMAKVAGTLLIIAGIALPLLRGLSGVPEGVIPMIVVIGAGLISIASGAMLVAGKPWAYIPALVMARLYLAGSTLLLFYIKYLLRGIAAMAISFLMLAALRGVRRVRS